MNKLNYLIYNKKSLITSQIDEKPPFSDNLASANLSFGEGLYSRSFLVDVIDLLIASSIKGIKFYWKYMPRLFVKAILVVELELMFTNTDVHKIVRISKTNQNNPMQICKMLLKQNIISYFSV